MISHAWNRSQKEGTDLQIWITRSSSLEKQFSREKLMSITQRTRKKTVPKRRSQTMGIKLLSKRTTDRAEASLRQETS